MGLTAPLVAQKPAVLKAQGETAFADRRWAEALDNLSQYQAVKPGDFSVLAKIGQSAYHLHQPEKARQYLEYLTNQGRSTDPEIWFYWARTLHGLQEWERAEGAYKQFLRLAPANDPFRAFVRDNIRRCVSGQSTRPNDDVALVENLGDPVNSPGDEFAPLPSPNFGDRLYFASSRQSSTGGLRNDDGYEDLRTGHRCSDMLVARHTTRGWEPPSPFSSLQNTARFEVAYDFTNNGKVLCFFRGFTLYGGELLTDTAGLTDEYRSTSSTFSSPMRPEAGDCTPFFFNDSTLLFASRREGGQGGLDLWTCVRHPDGTWSEPSNLGPSLNTGYDEQWPFVARDGRTLYFSSNRTEGIGGLDVFRSTFDPVTQTWSAPVSMGLGVNSPGNDEGFRLAADGRTATFSSDRLTDNLGERDLYTAYFKEEVPEQLVDNQVVFAFLQKNTRNNAAPGTPEDVTLAPLYYTSERDLLTGTDNQKALGQAMGLANQFPQTVLLVTAYTEETGPAKFDLFAGIRRAEQVGKALTERGIAANRIVLRSAGPNFPLARNVVDGAPNPVGQRLNRRVEVGLLPASAGAELPFKATVQRPEVAQQMAAVGVTRLDEQSSGLLYRVEFATTRSVLTADALGMFTDVLIESETGSGTYRYVAGAVRQFSQTAALKRDLVAQGFTDATVVAYVNGLRVNRAEAVGLMKKYPDLAAYVRG